MKNIIRAAVVTGASLALGLLSGCGVETDEDEAGSSESAIGASCQGNYVLKEAAYVYRIGASASAVTFDKRDGTTSSTPIKYDAGHGVNLYGGTTYGGAGIGDLIGNQFSYEVLPELGAAGLIGETWRRLCVPIADERKAGAKGTFRPDAACKSDEKARFFGPKSYQEGGVTKEVLIAGLPSVQASSVKYQLTKSDGAMRTVEGAIKARMKINYDAFKTAVSKAPFSRDCSADQGDFRVVVANNQNKAGLLCVPSQARLLLSTTPTRCNELGAPPPPPAFGGPGSGQ